MHGSYFAGGVTKLKTITSPNNSRNCEKVPMVQKPLHFSIICHCLVNKFYAFFHDKAIGLFTSKMLLSTTGWE